MPKQYSQMVVSRLQDAGVDVDEDTMRAPWSAPVEDLMTLALSAGLSCGLLFSQSPAFETALTLS